MVRHVTYQIQMQSKKTEAIKRAACALDVCGAGTVLDWGATKRRRRRCIISSVSHGFTPRTNYDFEL